MADISSITLPGGGTYDLKDKNAVPKYGKGKNLLRNWYFVGGGTGHGVFPVNQRGATSGATTNKTYSIDGWKWTYGSSPGSWSLVSGGISVSPSRSDSAILFQELGNLDSLLNGENVTASVLYSDGQFYSGSITRNSGTSQIFVSIGRDWVLGMVANSMRLRFTTARTVVAVKLELGTEQTLCHNEGTAEAPVWVLNEIPDYEYALYRCITSAADPSDTYANKSLATRQDLTSIQATGTTNTTGMAIPAWAYFYLNGILHQAKTQIDQNATFTVNTNCEQVPEGGFNALETAIAGKGNTKYTGYYAATARTINHFVDVDKNFLILTTGVSTSGDRAMSIFMGFVSASNAAASRVFKVFEPSTGQYPCTVSVSIAGQISVTTTVAYVRVTILEFERTVF